MYRTVRPVTRITLPTHVVCLYADTEEVELTERRIGIGQYPSSVGVRLKNLAYTTSRVQIGKLHDITRNDCASVPTLVGVLKALAANRGNVYVFAPNMRQVMDVTGLWGWIDDGTLTLSAAVDSANGAGIVLGDPPTIIKLYSGNKRNKITLLGTENYGQRELMSIDEVREWSAQYLSLITEHDLGSWSVTAASQGWHAYRRTSMNHRIVVHTDSQSRTLERDSYYGGRCECMAIGRPDADRVYQLDVNSMYVAVSNNLHVPVEYIGQVNGCEYNGSTKHGCISTVRLTATEPLYPRRVRTIDGKHGEFGLEPGAVVYPTGRIITVLPGPELDMAIRRGDVQEVIHSAVYRTAPIFYVWNRFIWSIYKRLSAKNPPLIRRTVKAIMLGLYGRFGSRLHTWQTVKDRPPGPAWDWYYRYLDGIQGPVPHRVIAGVVQRYTGVSDSADTLPAVSAWITSAARVRLLEILGITGRNNVYYYDTDSVWTNKTGYDNLVAANQVDQTELGKLKLLGIHESVEFRGIKQYTIFDGAERDSVDDKIADGIAPNIKYSLAARQMPTAVVVHNDSRRAEKYRHGTVLANGSVEPLTVRDW